MKRFLLLALLCMTTTFGLAQVTWIGTGSDNNWSTEENWSTLELPTSSDDVIIPTGFTVALNVSATIKSIDIQGNAIINMSKTLTFNELSTIGDNATLNWIDGSIRGDGSTLVNNGTINTGNTVSTTLYIGVSTTLENNGWLNMAGSRNIYIYSGASLNNTSSGTITFLTNDAWIRGVNLTNDGLITTNLPNETDEVGIRTNFQNNNGTIQVDNGVFNLWSEATTQILTDGIYNVANGGTFYWYGNVTLVGTLTGNIQGTLNSRGYMYVNESSTATLSFSGNKTLNWIDGSIRGSGTLVNEGIINTASEDLGISDASTTLVNNGRLNMAGTGLLFIYAGASLRNASSGIISFIADGARINGVSLINEGLITTDFNEDDVAFLIPKVQNTGVIEAATGTLNISNVYTFDNQVGGVLSGVANLGIVSSYYFTNNGTVSPGLSPGTLTLSGNYLSSSNSVLEMELNGLTPDTQHDVLAISGTNVIFEGTIDVTLGFDPTIGDTFTIATTTGTITGQNLESPVNVTANGYNYSFSVSYPNDNSVVLTLDDRTLGLDEYANINAAIKVYPNPAKDVISLENSGNFQLLDAEIIDITGKIIQRIDLSSMNVIQTITLSNYASGVYYVRVNALNTTITKKIIKQ